MYDVPGAREWTDRWWRGLASHFQAAGVCEVPMSLTRGVAQDDTWDPRKLLFSQSCGYPLLTEFKNVLLPVLTPCYAVPGCQGSNYSSLLVVRELDSRQELGQFRGAVAAVNRRDSQSGFNALRCAVAPLGGGGPFFARIVKSGRHAASIGMVARGAADLCAIDCVTHAMLARYEPSALAGTRVIASTEPSPGLPYVTGAAAGQAVLPRLRDSLLAALTDPALAAVRDALFIAGGEPLSVEDYQILLERERTVNDLGWEPMPYGA